MNSCPNSLACRRPGHRRLVSAPLRWFTTIARPFIVVLNGSANTFLRGGVEPRRRSRRLAAPPNWPRSSRTSQAPEPFRGHCPVADRIHRLRGPDGRGRHDPRAQATAVDRTSTAADVVSLARSTGHSRFPVLGEDWDDIDGIVHVKQAIAVPARAAWGRPRLGAHDRAPLVPRRSGSIHSSSNCARSASNWPSWSTSTAEHLAW